MAKDLVLGVVVGLSIGIVFGSLFVTDNGPRLDPHKTQQIVDNHQHDIELLIDAVEALEREVATLKKRKK